MDQGSDLAAIRRYVNGLAARGWTAIYSTVQYAYRRAAVSTATSADYLTTIVLLTDGENNRGISGRDFLNAFRRLPSDVRDVRTFAIRFGDADAAALRRLTDATGGQLFDATTNSLRSAFKEIRGYQ